MCNTIYSYDPYSSPTVWTGCGRLGRSATENKDTSCYNITLNIIYWIDLKCCGQHIILLYTNRSTYTINTLIGGRYYIADNGSPPTFLTTRQNDTHEGFYCFSLSVRRTGLRSNNKIACLQRKTTFFFFIFIPSLFCGRFCDGGCGSGLAWHCVIRFLIGISVSC